MRLTPCAHGDREVLDGKDVGHRSAARRERGTAGKAGEESEDENRRHILRQDLWDLEDDKEREPDDIDRVAADLWQFLNRREDHCGAAEVLVSWSAVAVEALHRDTYWARYRTPRQTR